MEILRNVNVALEETADGHLDHGLEAGLFIAVHLVDTDVVLAVTGSSKLCRHFVVGFWEVIGMLSGIEDFWQSKN